MQPKTFYRFAKIIFVLRGFMARRHWSIDLLDFIFKRRIPGCRVPLLASVKLTYRCNLRCLGCPFHLRSNGKRAHMSYETAIASLDTLKRMGTRIVIFEGGEPFLWKDGRYSFSDIAAYARERFFRVGVTTNGSFPLEAPVDVLWVSVDGLPETHDRLRSNSFASIAANLRATTHPKVLVHFTMNRENWRDINGLAEMVRSFDRVRGMTVQFFYPYNQGEEPLALSPDERRDAVAEALRLKGRGFPLLNSASRLRAMIDNTWKCHEDILANVDPDGTCETGCYVKNRGTVNCAACGFTPVAEASGAIDFIPGSLMAGWKIFVSP